ncbi:hypothetical protein [Brevundimonas sp.]|uniref:hypothetical protein n=1 Tax=Brevundimonas sp. TaxID=1871086 RepID=UPI002BF06F42|nr:hypothetical protein [Brevundimonas sp.]HWQ85375.1 hypothetical protein [Brevundimonas sp.]
MGQKDYEKGQRDGSAGRYKKPFGLLDELIGTGDYARDSARRNGDYDKGYSNGKRNSKK